MTDYADPQALADLARSITDDDRIRLDPPDSVWAGIEAALATDIDQPTTDADSSAQIIDLAAEHRRRAPATVRSRRTRNRLLAAAAAVVAVVVGTSLFSQSETTLIARATNADMPEPHGGELVATTASRTDGPGLALDFSGEELPSTEPLEIWLIKPDLSDMVSLGLVDQSIGWVPVPGDVDLTEYSVVDVSIEPADGDPTHSGRSILRGSLVST